MFSAIIIGLRPVRRSYLTEGILFALPSSINERQILKKSIQHRKSRNTLAELIIFRSLSVVSSEAASSETEFSYEFIFPLKTSTSTNSATLLDSNGGNSDNNSSDAFQLSWDRVAIIAGSGAGFLLLSTLVYAIIQRRRSERKYEQWGQTATGTTAVTTQQQLSTAQLWNMQQSSPMMPTQFQSTQHPGMISMPGQFPSPSQHHFATTPKPFQSQMGPYTQHVTATHMPANVQQFQQFNTQQSNRTAMSHPMTTNAMPMNRTFTSVPQQRMQASVPAPGYSTMSVTSAGGYQGQGGLYLIDETDSMFVNISFKMTINKTDDLL